MPPTRSLDPKKAIVYIRVSTDKLKQELGAEAQRSACSAWAERNGVRIVEVVEEEISGGARTRPKMLFAIERLKTHRAGIMLCSKIDRFGRSMLYALQLKDAIQRAGARLAFAEGPSPSDNDVSADMHFNIMLVFAQYERNVIKQRIRDARAVMRGRRKFLGGEVPFGYRLVMQDEPNKIGRITPHGYLEPNPEEQAALETVRLWRSAGWSWRRCASEGAKQGLFRFKKPNHAWLRRIFRRDMTLLDLDGQGRPPYGFAWDKTKENLIEFEPEQDVLLLVAGGHLLGWSAKNIAQKLVERGVKTRSGREPTAKFVRSLLHSMKEKKWPELEDGSKEGTKTSDGDNLP